MKTFFLQLNKPTSKQSPSSSYCGSPHPANLQSQPTLADFIGAAAHITALFRVCCGLKNPLHTGKRSTVGDELREAGNELHGSVSTRCLTGDFCTFIH